MAKYELSDEQIKQLNIILSESNIKGRDAVAIVKLAQALSKPVEERKDNDRA